MITGGLFTQFFLQDGIRETDMYRALDAREVALAIERLRALWQALAGMPSPSEAETEDEFIFPVLDLLGWQYLLQPIADRRRRDVADALLFLSPEAKAAARPRRPIERLRVRFPFAWISWCGLTLRNVFWTSASVTPPWDRAIFSYLLWTI